MKLKKFLQNKVKGNPYYEGLTLATVAMVMVPLMFKMMFDIILYITSIVVPPLTIELIVMTMLVDSLLCIVMNSDFTRQFKTDLWDGLESTLEVVITMYNVLYIVLLILLPFTLLAVVGFKLMLVTVVTMVVILVLFILKKGKQYDAQQNGLTDYKAEIHQK